MKRATTILGLLAVFLLLTGFDCGGDPPGGASFAAGQCPSNTYVGDVGGAPATVRVTIEPLVTYTYVRGELRSATAYYTFTADMPGARGWGDMVDHVTNQRFRIQIDLIPNGFILTANPFGGAASYRFTCQ